MDRIPFQLNIPPGPRVVMDTLRSAGFSAHAVGGCVRDALLGRVPEDWDLATDARPQAVRAALEPAGMPVIDTGLRHGTVTVLADGGPVEVTTYRTDGPYADGRRPQSVTFTADLEADLARRDFTLNAMAADGTGLWDPFGGRADLQAGVIRAVGIARQRFEEDGLRVLRALRFASTLDFQVEAATAEALVACAPMLGKVSGERVGRELMLLLSGPGAERVLGAFAGVLGVIIPEIIPCMGYDQRNHHHIYDVWGHTLRAVGAAPADPVVRLSLLLHDLGKPHTFSLDSRGVGHFYGHGEVSCRMAADIAHRLRLDGHTRRRVLALIRYHDSDLLATRASIKRWLRRLDAGAMGQLIAVKRADNAAQSPRYSRQADLDAAQAVLGAVLDEKPCLRPADLAVSGRDLMALGAEPGPGLGRMLDGLLEAVTDGRCLNARGPLLELARALMKQA